MISFQTASDFLLACWRARKVAPLPTVFLIGPPGIGKTSVPLAVVAEMGPDAQIEVLDLTSRLPEDIGGLPFREGGKTCYSPQDWAVRLSRPDAVGCLVFDDLPAASAATAAAVRQIVLDRRIHDVVLAPGVLIVVTGNRREDLAGAMTLPSHFRNAVCILEMEPQFAKWSQWFTAQGGNPAIISFLHSRPALFSTTPSKADTRGRFATPRSWTMLSACLPAAERAGCVEDVVMGYVGEGAGVEFMAFFRTVANLPPINQIFHDPRGTIPNPKTTLNNPDRVIAVTTGLSLLAVQQTTQAAKTSGKMAHRSAEALHIFDQFCTALSWVVGENVEHGAAAILSFSTLGGSNDLLQVYAAQASPAVRPMLQDIKQMMSGS